MKSNLYKLPYPNVFQKHCTVLEFVSKITNCANQITDKNCCRKQKNSKAQKVFKTEVAYLLIKIMSLWLLCVSKGSCCL